MSRKKKKALKTGAQEDAPAAPKVVPEPDGPKRMALGKTGDATSPSFGLAGWKAVALLFGLALVARLWALGRADLWCDEILFVGRSHAPKSPLRLLAVCWREFLLVTHLPLPEILQNLFLWLCLPFDPDLIYNNGLQRLPAALWGAGSVALLFRLGAKIVRPATAWVAALSMCFFFYPVYYSREVYYYAPLIFFAAAAFNLYADLLIRRPVTRRAAVALAVCLSAMALSHLTGILLVFLLFLFHLGWLGCSRIRRANPPPDSPPAPPARSTLWFLPALLLALPFVLRLALQPVEPLMEGSPLSVPRMLLYVLGKFTLGTARPWGILGVGIMVLGFGELLAKGPQREARRSLGLFTLAGFLILAVWQTRTQFAVRYFTVLLPLFMLIWAAGLETIARSAARLGRVGASGAERMTLGLGAVFILAHLAFFLPPLYQLRAKGRDYGGLARWLTENLRPGTPYFFEYGGWDSRFVPVYFPTLGLAHAITETGYGPEFHAFLREQQTNLVARFPESAGIEAAGAEWPPLSRFYRRKHELRNEGIIRLIRKGIWFELPLGDRTPGDLNIWYNTRDDAADLAREAGAPAYFDFEGAECAQMAQDVYVHAAQGNRMTVRVVNLAPAPQRGRFRLEGALNTSQALCPLYVTWQNQLLLQTSCVQRTPWILETPPVELPAGEHELVLRAGSRDEAPVLNVAVLQADFLPVP
ncbi:MAG TPA: hypothetical protein P5567_15160 [Kiritimatiellia bacterium]|nr:hypothetical protein [Kiritimatiellia bacterium]HRZ13780.1 hypothetical protein [Kiritimatiellia bacterium]HSA19401.1 hypothetical protein [Kiritimatiellia bacterium]